MPPIVNPYAKKRRRPPEPDSACDRRPVPPLALTYGASVVSSRPIEQRFPACFQSDNVVGDPRVVGKLSAMVSTTSQETPNSKSTSRPTEHPDFSGPPAAASVPTRDPESMNNSHQDGGETSRKNNNVAYPCHAAVLNCSFGGMETTKRSSFDGDDIDWDQVARSADQVSKQREDEVPHTKLQANASSPRTWRRPNSLCTGSTTPGLKRAPSAGMPPSHPTPTPAVGARGIFSSGTASAVRPARPVKLDRPQHWQKAGSSSSTPASRSSSLNNRSSSSDPAPRIPSVLQISSPTKPVQDKHRQSLVQHANLSSPLLNGWTLFSHQKKAILRALLMRRFILALDCGLGKTLIGCVWAKAFRESFEDLHIVLVCPVSMKEDWTRTAREATGLNLAQANKGKDDDNESVDGFIYSWAKVPTQVAASPYVVICDEAHCMQSLEAARTKQTLKLVKNERTCIGVLLLTGTPMKNGKPSNLFPLLKAVKHPFGKHKKAYEAHFCDGKEKSFGSKTVWDANGASNLSQLRNMVSSHLLHMTKEDCLKDLPPRTRVVRQTPVGTQHQLRHNQAWQDLARLYGASDKMQDWSEAVLVAVSRVRQIGSFAKVDATVALAQEILQTQPAVVIFTSFAKVAKLVHSRLVDSGWDGELLTGETPQKKRQGMVDKFQEGLSPIFVATFGAGGVGLTLTAAHSIILLDRPWTPGDAQQAEDRVRRIGQTKPVTSIWMVAFDLDKQIDAVLESKQSAADTVLAGEREASFDADNSGTAKISIFSLLKSVLQSK